jgi:stage II sporulation protein D
MNHRWRAAGVVVSAAALMWLALPAMALGSSLIVIQGHGWGNGVGMSQWGANGYAAHGWGYERILAHYYPHTTMSVARDQPIRVLLANGKSELTIGSAKAFVLMDSSGQTIHLHALRLTAALRVSGQVLVPPLTVEPGEEPLTLNGAGYRGSFEIDRSDGSLAVVNTVPLERYVRGVVPSEMPADWSPAAYEVQAVAARSYALANLHPAGNFDVYADNRSQVYGGIRSERPATNSAVGATAGEILTYDDQVIDAYYDSDSGGRTAAVQDVFPTDSPEPYLVPVSDPFDASPHRRWQVAIDLAALSRRFDVPVNDVQVQLNPSGRASAVRLLAGKLTRTLAAATFSSALDLRSTYFTVGVAFLNRPTSTSLPSRPVILSGFLRDVSGVVLQKRSSSGTWTEAAPVVAESDGRFRTTVRPQATTAYRLIFDHIPGPAVTATVARVISPPQQLGPFTTVISIQGP